MRTSPRGIRFIGSWEGFSETRYLDAVGVPTIGFGTTAADVSPLPMRCTREQAERWLAINLERKYEPAINSLGSHLNQNQFDALVSLAYNCGPGVVNWQIGKDVRNKNMKAASADFMRYVYAGGRPLQGLINRRRAERRLFDSAAAAPPAPSKITEEIWVANRTTGEFEIFAEDADGRVWHRWQKRGNWYPWVTLGKP